jgi:hypothetical protein
MMAPEAQRAIAGEAALLFRASAEYGATASSCVRAIELVSATLAQDPTLLERAGEFRALTGGAMMLAQKMEGLQPLCARRHLASNDQEFDAMVVAEGTVLRAMDGNLAAPTGWTRMELAAMRWAPRILRRRAVLTAGKALLCLFVTGDAETYFARPDLAAEGVLIAACGAFGLPWGREGAEWEEREVAARAYTGAALRALRAAMAEEDSAVLLRRDFRSALTMFAARQRGTALADLEALPLPLTIHGSAAGALRKERTETVKDRVLIRALLGEGVYGCVYRVVDLATHQEFGIKEVPAYETCGDGLMLTSVAELAIHRAVSGAPDVVELLWWRLAPRSFFLALPEYASTLTKLLRARTLAPGEGLAVLSDLCAALEHIHSFGILHLDVKPSNVLVDPATLEIRLCDFSISEVWDVALERSVSELLPDVQSLWYRCPSVIARCGARVPALDIWSLGIVATDVARNLCGMCTLSGPLRGPTDTSGEDQLEAIFKAVGSPEAWGAFRASRLNKTVTVPSLDASPGLSVRGSFPGRSPGSREVHGTGTAGLRTRGACVGGGARRHYRRGGRRGPAAGRGS